MLPLDNNMTCKKCMETFSRFYILDGKKRNACQRKYCFKCSPIGKHNTKKLEKDLIIKSSAECSKCRNILDLSMFYLRPTRDKKPHSMCKRCVNTLTKERQKALKLEAILYKGGGCVRCGYSKSPAALDFHHTNPKEKDFTIARKSTAAFNTIQKELDKCILLCANCHREEHSKKYKVPSEGYDPPVSL